MIYGYPNRPTVIAGQPLRLHYSGDRPKFALDIYRQGPNPAPDWVMRFPAQGWLDSELSAFQSGDANQNWPFIDIPIPSDAAPGVYVTNFAEADDANGSNATAPSTATPDARNAEGALRREKRHPWQAHPAQAGVVYLSRLQSRRALRWRLRRGWAHGRAAL